MEKRVQTIVTIPGAHPQLSFNDMFGLGEIFSNIHSKFPSAMHGQQKKKWNPVCLLERQSRQNALH
jgi:hypothetical protein